MGQWIQEGERTIFETVLSVAKMKHTVNIPSDKDNLDGLNFLSGKRVDEVNKMAELGTLIAHVDGGVPNLKIEIPELSVAGRALGTSRAAWESAIPHNDKIRVANLLMI